MWNTHILNMMMLQSLPKIWIYRKICKQDKHHKITILPQILPFMFSHHHWETHQVKGSSTHFVLAPYTTYKQFSGLAESQLVGGNVTNLKANYKSLQFLMKFGPGIWSQNWVLSHTMMLVISSSILTPQIQTANGYKQQNLWLMHGITLATDILRQLWCNPV